MLEPILLALQAFQVLFLWFHDWIPLGRLNDVTAVRRQDALSRLVLVTLIQSVPFTIGLFYSARYFQQPYPGWLNKWLWISYGGLLLGQMRAWWVPYLLKPEPERAERYRKCSETRTHSFRGATAWSPIPRISCFIWRRQVRCSVFC
jgi:hypothetical protein